MTSNRFAITVTVEREQNEFYNPEKSNNGGGYHQPYYEGYISDRESKEKYFFEFSNTSCGDFGSRYSVSVYQISNNEKKYVASAYFGSMLQNNFISSSFDENVELHNNIKEILEEEFGINIPTTQELEEDEDYDE